MYIPPDSQEVFGVSRRELMALDLDVATLEYFGAAAFDERVTALLEFSDIKETKISIPDLYTDQIILPGELGFNEMVRDEAIGHVSVEVRATETVGARGPSLTYNFAIKSEGLDDDTVLEFTRNNSGLYDVYNRHTDTLFSMSPFEVARLAFRTIDQSTESIDNLAEKFGKYAKEYHGFIEKIWHMGAEAHDGKVVQDHFVSGEMFDDIRQRKADLRLGYRKTEKPSESEILLTLEKAFVYTELESEEVYRLEVLYATVKDNHTDEEPDRAGIKTIRGDGGLALKSITMIHDDLGGRKTPLDVNDPTIMQDFVEAYETLLQEAA